jgi:GT2 family glycosyltransferase
MFSMTVSAQTPHSTAGLSVVLVVPDRFDGIARILRHLQAQTITRQLEIILVTPSAGEAAVDEAALACFGAWRLIEFPGLSRGGAGRAAGVRHATAPLVVFAEDHCFPEPNWAESLLEAFRRHPEAGGIVPSMANGNPGTLTSWADLYINFGPYVDHTSSRALDHLPWHSGCFRRKAFAGYEADLPHLLEVETLWHDHLLQDGYALRITPGTQIYHYNFSRPRFFLREQYVNGRIFGSVRAEPMPVWRRGLRASAAPLVQTRRFVGILKDLRRSKRLGLLPRLLPILGLGLAANGFGEFVGCIFGTGQAREAKFDLECRRYRFMTGADGSDLLDPDRSLLPGKP